MPCLSNDLKITDGAIATHVRRLARDGLIKVGREEVGSRTRTVFLITEKGIRTLEGLFDHLSHIGADLK